MGRRRRVKKARTWAAPIALGVALVVAPQLLGGVYGWGIAIIAALTGLACIVAAWTAHKEALRIPLDALAITFIGLLAWTILQGIPLPAGWVEALQPQAVDMAREAARLRGADGPGWLPLSLAPGGTRAEVVKGFAIVAAFLAGWLLAALGHRERALMAVGISTLVMALVGLAHLAAGTELIFGVYQQIDTRSSLPAPLVNQNHLSGFLAMGAPLILGFGLDAPAKGLRLAWLAAAALVAAAALLAVSRGGVASLVAGFATLGTLVFIRRRAEEGRRGRGAVAMIAATGVAGVALGLFVASKGLFRDFEAGDYSKLRLAAEGLGLAVEHPLLGVGRGAFSAAFVGRMGGDTRFTHPENWPAQWASEWGLVAAVILVLVLGAALARSAGRARSFAHLGALAAVVSIAVHDLVDFSMEMAGVAVVTAALLGALVAERPRRTREATPEKKRRPPAAWVALGVGALALLVGLYPGSQLHAESARELRDTLIAEMRASDRGAFAETLEHAVALHPSEPEFFLLAGAEAVRHDDGGALAWLNRAMALAPGWPAPHEEAARFLARRGQISQAFLELRQAEQRLSGRGRSLACGLITNGAPVEPLIRAAGEDAVGDAWLDYVAGCLPLDGPAALALDAHLEARDVPGPALRRARRALAANEPAEALAALESFDSPRGNLGRDIVLIRARAHRDLDEPARAAEILEQALASGGDPNRLLRSLAEAQAEAGDAEAMRATVSRLRGLSAGQARGVAAVWIFEGRLEERMGNDGRALTAFERAHRIDHDSNGLAQVARLAGRLGNHRRSYHAYAELCRLGGPESPHCALRDRARARLTAPGPSLPTLE